MNWISVKERLPETNQEVLVFCYGYNIEQVLTIWDGKSSFWDKGNSFMKGNGCPIGLIDVTHWMPLPEPPTETKRETE